MNNFAVKASLAAALVLSSAPAIGAEFFIESRPDGSTLLVMDGAIEQGDSQRMINLIKNSPVQFMVANGMRVNSTGGSVGEALKLARIVESSGLYFRVEGSDVCASACFVLYAAAPARWVSDDAQILVHRPYLAGTPKSSSEYTGTVKTQQQATSIMRDYLQARSIPSSLIDKMMTYPSTKAHRITKGELFDGIGMLSPVVEELTLKRCGLTNTNIQTDSRNYRDDLACIGEVIYPLKSEYTRTLIGDARYEAAYSRMLDRLSN